MTVPAPKPLAAEPSARPPAPHNPAADRVAWIAMAFVAGMGACVLVWATTLSAG